MSLSLLLPFAIAIFMGFFLVSIFWPSTRPGFFLSMLKWLLAAGIGMGFSSCLFFLWLLFSSPSAYGLFEMGVFVCLAVLFFLKKRGPIPFKGEDFFSFPPGNQRLCRILTFSFWGLLLCALASFILFSVTEPHGGWDAWAIWNLRARFLFKGGAVWRDAFSALLDWSHPDYPLLLPGSVARTWEYSGQATPFGPILISSLFTFATIGLIVFSISGLRGFNQGYLAGIVLLGTHYLVREGASQYADVPLGFYFLATFVLFSYRRRTAGGIGNLPLLAGITAGLSAWTKNEGLLFLAAIFLTQFAGIAYGGKRRSYTRPLLFFSAGLLPLLLIILYFKASLAPPNDLISSLNWKVTSERILDSSRYFLISRVFLEEISRFPIFMLAFYFLCLGITANRTHRSESRPFLWVLGIMLLGYFFIYVITPQDLAWHLDTSLRRLLLQLWPSAVFTFFLFARTPEEPGKTLFPLFLRFRKKFLKNA
jgi:hypothetical protein